MKTLRYLLMAFTAMMVVNVQAAQAKAQSMAQEPQVGFQSTSSMVGSGSTLPQAVQTGAYTTYDQEVWRGNGGIKRGLGGDDGEVTIPDDNADIDATPIGDGLWALLALACAYLIMRVVRQRTRA